ncbi:MAG: LPXTG cell wall anchor domain-containing protein [Burkholderiales bacterium]
MRNKIFGGIGILWGGAIVIWWLVTEAPESGSAAYQSGQYAAVVFGVLMLLAGLYFFFKKSA